MDYQRLLEQIAEEVAPQVGRGKVADYIPALAAIPADRFGMAIATVDGEIHGVGDWQERFSVQSISKIYSLALTLSLDGDTVWSRVGREPSGNPFNSLIQLEFEKGIPRNPFINAGALVITDRLQTVTGNASSTILEFLRREVGDPTISVDPLVAESEAAEGSLNAALAYFMAAHGNIENNVNTVLGHYVRHCAIAMSCRELAKSTVFLARHGICQDGSRFVTPDLAKRINAVMLTCGTYDAAGDFAYRVGLPGKSGVGGGIVAIVPRRCVVAVWSPGLDTQGNSVAGVAALDRFSTITGWSVF